MDVEVSDMQSVLRIALYHYEMCSEISIEIA